jgi:hypothetical protein
MGVHEREDSPPAIEMAYLKVMEVENLRQRRATRYTLKPLHLSIRSLDLHLFHGVRVDDA